MFQFTVSEDFHEIVTLRYKAGSNQGRSVNPGVDGKPLKILHIHYGVHFLEDIVKAALWQSALERHLTAFETQLDASAGTGLMSLMTTGCCLAMT